MTLTKKLYISLFFFFWASKAVWSCSLRQLTSTLSLLLPLHPPSASDLERLLAAPTQRSGHRMKEAHIEYRSHTSMTNRRTYLKTHVKCMNGGGWVERKTHHPGSDKNFSGYLFEWPGLLHTFCFRKQNGSRARVSGEGFLRDYSGFQINHQVLHVKL